MKVTNTMIHSQRKQRILLTKVTIQIKPSNKETVIQRIVLTKATNYTTSSNKETVTQMSKPHSYLLLTFNWNF